VKMVTWVRNREEEKGGGKVGPRPDCATTGPIEGALHRFPHSALRDQQKCRPNFVPKFLVIVPKRPNQDPFLSRQESKAFGVWRRGKYPPREQALDIYLFVVAWSTTRKANN
jgi:hypothetical protein